MVTDEERHDVAEGIRRICVLHNVRYDEQFMELLRNEICTDYGFVPYDDVAQRLADLIDPEGGNDAD
jgi:hypothetical protein